MFFLMIVRTFPKISKIVPKAKRTSPKIFWEFPKIPEDVQRFPKTSRKTRKCFDDTPTITAAVVCERSPRSFPVSQLLCINNVAYTWRLLNSYTPFSFCACQNWGRATRLQNDLHMLIHSSKNDIECVHCHSIKTMQRIKSKSCYIVDNK